MKPKNTLKITLLISLILHLGIFFLIKDVDLLDSQKPQERKMKLSFKRGGDIKKDDSTLKENTSITNPSQIAAQIQSQPTLDSSTQAQMPHLPQLKDSKNSKDSKNKADSTLSFDFANLSINGNQTQNLKGANRQKALELLSKLPQDRRNEIVQLYGDELGDYGLAEIEFITNNLREIGRITQYYINMRGYPMEAVYLRQSGSLIVEFYLHPNGDISELKITDSSKSIILDKDFLTTLNIAFKDYPRPSTKTKIIYSMRYRLL